MDRLSQYWNSRSNGFKRVVMMAIIAGFVGSFVFPWLYWVRPLVWIAGAITILRRAWGPGSREVEPGAPIDFLTPRVARVLVIVIGSYLLFVGVVGGGFM
jgi:hypothetical protein